MGGLVVLMSALGAAAAGAQYPVYTVDAPYDWPESSPQDQAVDPETVADLLESAARLPYMRSMLVVRHGALIGERYYGTTKATDATAAMSVSKSFLSALFGIAQHEGFLDIDQPMLDFFPEYVPELEPIKADITIRHMLMMTSGFPGDEYAIDWVRWLLHRDQVGFCLEQPLESSPGTDWHYSTCTTHIGSALLDKATGMSTREFAELYLFEPLGITLGSWGQDPMGYYRGGWDMYFTPRDLARFGHLYLEKGKLDGTRIISRKWVRKSTRRRTSFADGWGSLERPGYGYWWWTGNSPDIYKMYFALGYGGQFVINVPKLDMTIVATAEGDYRPTVAERHERNILGLIEEHLLRPLKSGSSGISVEFR